MELIIAIMCTEKQENSTVIEICDRGLTKQDQEESTGANQVEKWHNGFLDL